MNESEKLLSKKKADEKWRSNNREHANYLRGRSAAKSFIRNKATEEDLIELLQLIQERKKGLSEQ